MDIFTREINDRDIYMINAGLDLKGCKFLGEGRNGRVFLLPNNHVIKICRTARNCSKEAKILKTVNGNKYFPRIYYHDGSYMIRDFVDGKNFKEFVKEHGLPRQLILNLIELLEEFKNLNFTKIDIRCKDMYVQDDLSLKVIDPKGCYSREKNHPSHLMKGLKKLGVVGWFKKVLCEERPVLYQEWIVKNNLVDKNFGY